MKEEWLFPNAVVPVDVETTAALVAEIHRLIDVVGGMALAQPAQEPDNGDDLTIAYMSGVHRGKELAAQPAQEPDAQITVEHYTGDFENITVDFCNLEKGVHLLYTTPQQRPWVGLTDEERKEVWWSCEQHTPTTFARAIEAKLKEKNHG